MDQQDPAMTPAYRVREIAVLLSVNDSTVYRWIEKGTLPAYKFEDSIRVAPEDFEEFRRNSIIKPARKLPSAAAQPSDGCGAKAAVA